MKKTIAIYFSDPEPMGYPFDKSEYLEIYQIIISQLESRGIEVFIVRADSYRGNGNFTHGWRFTGPEQLEEVADIKADLIFNRDDKNTIPFITDCNIINHAEFDDLCLDKVRTFEYFPDISPKSASIHSYDQYINTMKSWDFPAGEHVVLKKNFETEGRGIVIEPWDQITVDAYEDWESILLQEFVDSSGGIPGITDTHHDLRVTVVNHKPLNSFVRNPKEGSLLANIGQGGSGRSIGIEEVPAEVLELVSQIDQQCSKYEPCLYSADFMLGKRGWKLIELNSRPGVQHPSWSGSYEKYNNAVVDMLVQAVSQ